MDLRPNDAAVAAGAAEAWSEAPSEAAGNAAAPSATEPVPDRQQTAQKEAQQRACYTGVPRVVITASYFACFCSIGVSLAALGPILLQLSTALDAEVDSLGFLFVARSAGYLCGSIAAGWLFDRVRHTHALLLGGMLLSSAGCALLPRCTSVGAAAAAVSTQGVCMGLLDTGGNCLLIWLHGPRRVEPFMQAMHGFFGLGAFASPLLIEWSIAATGGYRAALDGLSLALALAAAPLLCYRGPAKPAEEGEEAGQVAAARAQRIAAEERRGRRRFVGCCALTLGVYVGTEVAFGGFVFAWAHTQLGLSASRARLLNSAFWGALALGRLLAIGLATRFSPVAMLLADFAGCLLAAALLCVAPRCEEGIGGDGGDGGDGDACAAGLPLVWLATGLFGLAMASIFPTMLTYAERVMPVTGRVASLFVVGAALGEMLVPLLVATLFKLDPSWFVLANITTSAAQLAAFFAAWRLGCMLTKGTTSRGTAASSSIELQHSSQLGS